eukprot:TRINITY_DN2430_c0_g1_i5.p1 TRINITY_DN2430_c0_g1~~TRINITY_DN2430_c0_g1_i5.p1  ORF type:complete len:1310 (-),score=353.47 TRINITY_DN2430_c0_g1_i5:143-3715(-)
MAGLLGTLLGGANGSGQPSDLSNLESLIPLLGGGNKDLAELQGLLGELGKGKEGMSPEDKLQGLLGELGKETEGMSPEELEGLLDSNISTDDLKGLLGEKTPADGDSASAGAPDDFGKGNEESPAEDSVSESGVSSPAHEEPQQDGSEEDKAKGSTSEGGSASAADADGDTAAKAAETDAIPGAAGDDAGEPKKDDPLFGLLGGLVGNASGSGQGLNESDLQSLAPLLGGGKTDGADLQGLLAEFGDDKEVQDLLANGGLNQLQGLLGNTTPKGSALIGLAKATKNDQCIFNCKNGAAPRPRKGHKASSNGCGVPGFMVESQYGMTECCNQHDLCYGTCQTGDEQAFGKHGCDSKFEACVHSRCTAFTDLDLQGCEDEASLFTMAVRMFGCPAYEKSQARACSCTDDASNEVVQPSGAKDADDRKDDDQSEEKESEPEPKPEPEPEPEKDDSESAKPKDEDAQDDVAQLLDDAGKVTKITGDDVEHLVEDIGSKLTDKDRKELEDAVSKTDMDKIAKDLGQIGQAALTDEHMNGATEKLIARLHIDRSKLIKFLKEFEGNPDEITKEDVEQLLEDGFENTLTEKDLQDIQEMVGKITSIGDEPGDAKTPEDDQTKQINGESAPDEKENSKATPNEEDADDKKDDDHSEEKESEPEPKPEPEPEPEKDDSESAKPKDEDPSDRPVEDAINQVLDDVSKIQQDDVKNLVDDVDAGLTDKDRQEVEDAIDKDDLDKIAKAALTDQRLNGILGKMMSQLHIDRMKLMKFLDDYEGDTNEITMEQVEQLLQDGVQNTLTGQDLQDIREMIGMINALGDEHGDPRAPEEDQTKQVTRGSAPEEKENSNAVPHDKDKSAGANGSGDGLPSLGPLLGGNGDPAQLEGVMKELGQDLNGMSPDELRLLLGGMGLGGNLSADDSKVLLGNAASGGGAPAKSGAEADAGDGKEDQKQKATDAVDHLLNGTEKISQEDLQDIVQDVVSNLSDKDRQEIKDTLDSAGSDEIAKIAFGDERFNGMVQKLLSRFHIERTKFLEFAKSFHGNVAVDEITKEEIEQLIDDGAQHKLTDQDLNEIRDMISLVIAVWEEKGDAQGTKDHTESKDTIVETASEEKNNGVVDAVDEDHARHDLQDILSRIKAEIRQNRDPEAVIVNALFKASNEHAKKITVLTALHERYKQNKKITTDDVEEVERYFSKMN